MVSLNKVTLIGNCGKDPEIRTTGDGKEIANFSIATSESWNDKATGEKREKTEWHRIVVFNEGLVRIVKNYVKKGTSLYIEGSLQTRKWQDSSGVEKYTTEIVLQGYLCNLKMLGGVNRGASDDSTNSAGSSSSDNSFNHNDLDDEIPF